MYYECKKKAELQYIDFTSHCRISLNFVFLNFLCFLSFFGLKNLLNSKYLCFCISLSCKNVLFMCVSKKKLNFNISIFRATVEIQWREIRPVGGELKTLYIGPRVRQHSCVPCLVRGPRCYRSTLSAMHLLRIFLNWGKTSRPMCQSISWFWYMCVENSVTNWKSLVNRTLGQFIKDAAKASEKSVVSIQIGENKVLEAD
jgi:hypothetical protein